MLTQHNVCIAILNIIGFMGLALNRVLPPIVRVLQVRYSRGDRLLLSGQAVTVMRGELFTTPRPSALKKTLGLTPNTAILNLANARQTAKY